MRPLPQAAAGLLLQLARAAVHDAASGEVTIPALLESISLPPELEVARGVFVSLKLRGESPPGRPALRGCLGQVEPSGKLYRAAIDVAARAATEDPRFEPIGLGELARLELELSILGPLRELRSHADIDVHRHGVELRHEQCRAVYLPQVAREQGWDRATLLEQLALKAGLDCGAWRGARLSVFEVERVAGPWEPVSRTGFQLEGFKKRSS